MFDKINELNKTASYNSLLNCLFVVVASDLQKKTGQT
jgi:hypothetical protein